METINKLLKKQAPKTNARRKELNAGTERNGAGGDITPGNEAEPQKPNPLFVRWVSNKDGMRICVPEEWLEAPVGSIFNNSVKPVGMRSGKLIEEVQ